VEEKARLPTVEPLRWEPLPEQGCRAERVGCRHQEPAKELRDEVEKLIASGKAAGLVRPGAVEVWADIWLQIIGLMLERVANKEWTPDQAAPRLAVESAWAAIAAASALSEPSPMSPPTPPPEHPAPSG